MSTLTLRQKWHTRNTSMLDYLTAVRRDRRQAAYKLLPLVTHPGRRQALARAVAWFQPSSRPLALDERTRARRDALAQEGVLTELPPVPAGQLKDMLEHFQAQPCHDPWRPHLGEFAWDAPPSLECNMGMYSAEQIVRAPHVLQLFNQPWLLQLAEAYIGCKPTLDNVGCWWSYSGRTQAKGTQKFHRDFDNIGGFKVFFYLTEVGLAQGPHEYVRGSHRRQTLDTGAGIADEELWRHYDPRQTQVITGPAGTCFITDTFGIHRGQLPSSGMRLMLSAQYNIHVSPHGPRQPFVLAGAEGLDPYVNRLYRAVT